MKKSSSFWMMLINPFTRIGGWKAFYLGLVVLLLTTVVGYFCRAIPVGLLQVRPMDDISIGTFLICQLSVLLVLILVIYITAIIATKHVRFQDVLGVITLAQAPLLLLLAIAPSMKWLIDSVSDFLKTGDSAFLSHIQSAGTQASMILFATVVVAVLVWYFALLFNGFKTLTDLKRAKCILVFIAVVIISDMLSSLLITLLTKGAISRFILP